MPVRTNGIDMSMVELIESLDTIAGAHGVGRIDMVESSLAAVKSRDIYEAPAATVLHAAHKELEHRHRPHARAARDTSSGGPTRTSSTTASGSRRRARRSTRSCDDPAARHRLGSAEAVQGPLPRRRTQVAARAVRPAARAARPHVRRGAPSHRLAASSGTSVVRAVRRRSRRGAVRLRRLVRVRSAAVRRRRDGEPGVGRGARAGRRADARRRRPSIRAALDDILSRGASDPHSSTRRRRGKTRTSTRSSSASSSRASATPDAGSTPAGRATNRSRSICGST